MSLEAWRALSFEEGQTLLFLSPQDCATPAEQHFRNGSPCCRNCSTPCMSSISEFCVPYYTPMTVNPNNNYLSHTPQGKIQIIPPQITARFQQFA
jgi:hypothetical protein